MLKKAIDYICNGDKTDDEIYITTHLCRRENAHKECVAYTEKSRIEDIVLTLESFAIEKALKKFSMEECKKADLYPNIWDYEEEADEIKEEIMDYFQNMKDFYKKILEANGNVLITIY